MKATLFLFTITVSVASMLYSAVAIPIVIKAVADRWKPVIDLSTPRAFLPLLFIVVPAIALISLRRRRKERKERLVVAVRYTAASSLVILSVVLLPLLILSLLPAREGGGTAVIELTIPGETELNQSVEPTASSGRGSP